MIFKPKNTYVLTDFIHCNISSEVLETFKKELEIGDFSNGILNAIMKRFETLFSTSMTSIRTGFLLRSRILCQSETRVNQHFLEAWWTNERVMKQIHNDVSSQSKHLNRFLVECRVNLRVSLMQHKGTIPARFMAQKKVQEPVVLQWCVWLSKKPTNLKWKQHCKSINRNSCCEIF